MLFRIEIIICDVIHVQSIPQFPYKLTNWVCIHSNGLGNANSALVEQTMRMGIQCQESGQKNGFCLNFTTNLLLRISPLIVLLLRASDSNDIGNKTLQKQTMVCVIELVGFTTLFSKSFFVNYPVFISRLAPIIQRCTLMEWRVQLAK